MNKYIAILLLVFSGSVYADVELVLRHDRPYININGEIKKGDFEKFEELVKRYYKSYSFKNENYKLINILYRVDSSGGDVLEAMRIGRFIRNLKEDVYVDNYLKVDNSGDTYVHLGECLSACVFILIAGIDKGACEPCVGIHRPYFSKEYFSSLNSDEATAKYKSMMKEVEQYLIEMGATKDFIDAMFQVPSDQIRYLSLEEVDKWIDVTPMVYEEWLIAKCGTFSKQEADERDRLSEKSLADFMEGNWEEKHPKLSYLSKKKHEVEMCRSSAGDKEMYRFLVERYPGMNKELESYREKWKF